MKYTNKHGLPETLVNLTERDTYTKGAARISVTTLISAPRISILRQRHDDEIEVDVADGLWALVGRAIHHVAESGADHRHLPEERLFADVGGWVLSGGIDLQTLEDDGSISLEDYKFTSAWAVMHAESKSDWELQLNLYAWLVRKVKGVSIKRLAICALIRDWRKQDAERNPAYPQAPAKVIDIPLWDFERQQAYVEERVRVHQAAATASEFGDDLPHCTDEDRWVRGEKFAVVKIGNKKATKVFDTEPEAREWLKNQNAPQAFYVDHRPGEPVRCTGNYCRVAPFCEQYGQYVIETNMGDKS
jgi:hypothetical protein